MVCRRRLPVYLPASFYESANLSSSPIRFRSHVGVVSNHLRSKQEQPLLFVLSTQPQVAPSIKTHAPMSRISKRKKGNDGRGSITVLVLGDGKNRIQKYFSFHAVTVEDTHTVPHPASLDRTHDRGGWKVVIGVYVCFEALFRTCTGSHDACAITYCYCDN